MAVAEKRRSGVLGVVEEVRRELPDASTREVAEACVARADEETNAQVLLEGWADRVGVFDADWSAKLTVRSGHQNKSGRFSLLSQIVHFNSGAQIRLADMTAESLAVMQHEYEVRVQRNAAGVEMARLLVAALLEAKVERVAELGEERVAAIQRRAGFRV